MTTDELLDLKDTIEQAKETLAELTGQKKALMTQLKNEWNCTTIKQAEQLLDTMHNELRELNDVIAKSIKEIKEKYPL